jgi:hypothetical protein
LTIMASGARGSKKPGAVGEELKIGIDRLLKELTDLRNENKRLRRELAMRPMGRRTTSATGRDRKTPQEVDGEVVLAVLRRIGPATAAEIAGEITRAGVPVKGQAIRFLAEGAGARVTVDRQGQRRYHLPTQRTAARRRRFTG